MKIIRASGGEKILVDNEDYPILSRLKWHISDHGYAYCCKYAGNYKTFTFSMHQLILGFLSRTITDHINRNRLDNRKCNLRTVTIAQNCVNSGKRKDKCTSKYKGVSWSKQSKKWLVLIGQRRNRIYVGLFTNEKDAAKAYDKKALEVYGEYAYQNFPRKKGE